VSETASPNPADPATEFDGMRAPAALAAALRRQGVDISETQLADATGDLAKAGAPVTIRKGKERNPAFAAHVPVTTDGPLNFSYSAARSPGHANCCDPGGHHDCPRGLYQDDRLIAQLPYVWSIAVAKNGRTSITAPIMSATKDGTRAVIAWDDIRTGTWADALNTGLSPDRRIVTAAAAAIGELAHDEHTPQHPAAVTPAARTPTGHIPDPIPETMPGGYWDQPSAFPNDPARLQARQTQADIAAGRPKIALTWGASIGAAYAGPLKLRQSGIWELTGAARKGKTTALSLAAAAWGYPEFPPDGMLISWDQTSKGTGRHLGELGIFPAFMDETGTADFGPDEWARLTYSLSLGASRKTAKTRGSMGTNQTPGWQGFLFTTGNGTITDGATAGRFAGVAARVVTLSGEFTSGHDEASALAAAVLADYGWLGPEVIRTVSVDEFGTMYRAALAELDAPPGGVTGTLAGKVALAVAGAEAIDRILGTGTRIRDAALDGARDYLANLADPETDRERILRELAESMSAERSAWANQAGYDAWGTQQDRHRPKLAGLYDETWLYVYPTTWDAIVKQAGITGSASLALADMHDRGELHVPASRRSKGEWKAPAPRWAGSPWVYKISLAAASSPDAGDDAGNADSPTSSDAGIRNPLTSTDAGDADSSTVGDAGKQPTLTRPDAGDAGDAGQSLTRTRTREADDQAPTPDPFGSWPEGTAGAIVNEADTLAGPIGPAPKPELEYAQPAEPAASPTATSEGTPAMQTATGPPAAALSDTTVGRRPPEAPIRQPDPTPTAANLSHVGVPPRPAETLMGHPNETSTDPRAAFLTDVSTRKPFDRPECLAVLVTALDALDAAPAPDPADKTGSAHDAYAHTLKLADALVTAHSSKIKAGPFAPWTGKKPPLWQPWTDDALLSIITTGSASIITGYAYQRPYTGPVTVLDRNGAQIAAMTSVTVAHGGFTRTGPVDEVPARPAPGYYRVHVYPWTEPLMPSPLASNEPGTEIWIPAPTMALLRELSEADRWPDAGALDSWTADTTCRLWEWGQLCAQVRAYALTLYGRGTPQLDIAKKAFSQAKSMMLGKQDPATAMPRQIWPKGFNHRTDWAHAFITLASANLWRVTDACRQATPPGLSPVALRHTDELVVPTASLETIRSVITIDGDPTKLLKSFKTKGTEDW
jgi:hypothetical protein